MKSVIDMAMEAYERREEARALAIEERGPVLRVGEEAGSGSVLKVSLYRYGLVSAVNGRERQEDNAAVTSDRFAVFDGVGGERNGDAASRAGAEGFVTGLDDADRHRDLNDIGRAVLAAQRGVLGSGGMTTIAAVQVTPKSLHIAWSGDSRVYVLRERARLIRATEDHGIGSFLSKCLGNHDKWSPAQKSMPRQSFGSGRTFRDVLLLCTDGLTGGLTDEEIAEILKSGSDPQETARRLVVSALATGRTRDNITALVVDLGG